MKKILSLISIVLSVIFLTGCITGLESDLVEREVATATAAMKEEKPAGVKATEVSEEEGEDWQIYDDSIVDTSNYAVKYVKYENTGGLEELRNYGQYDDILYPGAIVDISKPAISVINLKQSPITMSISLESVDATYRPYIMTNPSLSAARMGVSKLVSNSLDKLTGYPARYSLETQMVSNSSAMNLALGLNVSYSGLKISDKFDYSTSSTANSIVLVLRQIYYTIDIDVKKGAGAYFDASLGEERVRAGLKDKLPAVVSSVSYGRVAVVRLTSQESLSNISNEFSAGYKKAVSASAAIDKKVSNNEIKSEIFIYGGAVSSDSSLGDSMTLSELIAEFNKEINPEVAAAVPISYRMRYLTDSSMAKIMMTNDPVYVKQYVQKKSAYKISLEGMQLLCNNETDENFLKDVNLYVSSLSASSLFYTTDRTSSNRKSTSERGTLSGVAGYEFVDNEIKDIPDVEVVVRNVDNEGICNGDLLSLEMTGRFQLRVDAEKSGFAEGVSIVGNIVGGPFGWLLDGVSDIFIDKEDGTIDFSFSKTITGYEDLMDTGGFSVDFSNGTMTIRLNFSIKEI